MRAHLVDGKLVEPTSELAAQSRHQQVAHEILKIEAQIALRGRRDLDWWRRAMGSLGWLRSEERQLAAWLAGRGVPAIPPREIPVETSAEG